MATSKELIIVIKKLLLTLIMGLTGLLMLSSAAAAQQAVKIGYVDLQKVIMESHEGKKAMAQLEKIKKSKNAELKKLFDKIKALEKQLKQKGVLKPAVRSEKLNLYEAKQRTYIELRARYSEEYLKKKIGLSKPIYIELTRMVKEIGKKEKYTLIFDYSASASEEELLLLQSEVLYAAPTVDLTNKVLKAYNAKHPSK